MGAASVSPHQPSEQHAVRLDDLFKPPHRCHAPIHSRVRVMKFDSRGDPANLRNREVRPREKQAMTLITVL